MSATTPVATTAAHHSPVRVRPIRIILAAALSLAVVLGLAGPAHAATAAEKMAVLTSFTQTSASSYNSWNNARTHQGDWAAYGFDWSTDFCSASPDRPLGFDFTLSCHRHDFGYRNYKAAGAFTDANKNLVDSAFYADLKRKCAGYSAVVRPACLSLAWTYYQAVSIFGSLASVDESDVDAAAELI
ncbi:phospholipase [Actinoplanes sp. NPDC026670]|uniref:phospholipase n=1 Tax=Actinoplanes sp. NPDC026670 TaxID=3154700 RepID=UPI0033F5C923